MRLAAAVLVAVVLGAVVAAAARTGVAQEGVERLTSLSECGSVDVNFDDLANATHVSDQYAALGVRFVDDASTTPLIYANSSERTTSSPPNSLANGADFPGTSANVPLTLNFDQAQSKVGFYIGNGIGASPAATLTAYNAAGTAIGAVTTLVTANDLTQFFGIEVAAGGIRRVTLDYGNTSLSEEIDDLCFEAPPPPPAPAVLALPYREAMLAFSPRILFSFDLAIHGIEITQAIQCFNTAAGLSGCPDNSLPVVQGKTTGIRIYLKYSSLLSPTAANIPGRLWYRVAGGSWNFVNVSGTAKQTLSQVNADDSTNVFFNVTSSSPSINVEFYAEVDPANTLSESNEANNRYPASGSITMTFQRRASFRVVGRSIHYHPSGYSGTQDPAGWAITGGGAMWWNQLLPLKNNAIAYSLASGSKDWTTTLTAAGQHSLIQSLNSDWVWGSVWELIFGGITPARHVYGWTPNAGFSGGHADMPVYPHAGGSGIVGIGTDNPGTSTDNPGSGAIILGHELTHDYDVKHTNTADSCGSSDSTTDFPYTSSSIQEVGFNPITGMIYNPTGTHDLMSYCPPGSRRGWISPFTWNKMFPLLAPSSSFAFAFASWALLEPESLVVDATLFRDGGGELGTLQRMPVASMFSPNEDGAYAIELRGVEGDVLSRTPFAVNFQGEETEGPFAGLLPQAARSFTIPFVQGTRSVALLFADKVLDERPVSSAPPSVEITSATARSLEWRGTDDDGDALTYSVFYSRDGGQSWQLLASELEASSLEIDTDRMAGSSNARFRVAASDGVNTGVSDMSDAVQIPNKPPVATIMDPRNGVRVPAGSLVVLLGTALDLEDGMLDDGALSWSRAGVSLGTGSTIPVLLDQPGTYTFELRATDADGATGVATTAVLVGSVDTPTVTPSPSTVGQAVVASARAHGVGAGASCTVDYGDGSGALSGTMSGDVCTGPPHVYLAAAEYPAVVLVRDNAGEVGQAGTHHTVTDVRPTSAFATGGGWFGPGASKVHFEFVVRYAKNALTPSGMTKVGLPAGELRSTGFEWLAVDGSTVRYLGHATLGGVGGYDFVVEATDGGQDDAFRVRVWKRATGEPVFGGGGPLGGGSVVLHK